MLGIIIELGKSYGTKKGQDVETSEKYFESWNASLYDMYLIKDTTAYHWHLCINAMLKKISFATRSTGFSCFYNICWNKLESIYSLIYDQSFAILMGGY